MCYKLGDVGKGEPTMLIYHLFFYESVRYERRDIYWLNLKAGEGVCRRKTERQILKKNGMHLSWKVYVFFICANQSITHFHILNVQALH